MVPAQVHQRPQASGLLKIVAGSSSLVILLVLLLLVVIFLSLQRLCAEGFGAARTTSGAR
jgi:hypothetical protein